VVVALGKFDAMHRGHRMLASQASRMGAQPVLLSFSGMAEVLGWPQRMPLVATCDRPRVLRSWAPFCLNRCVALGTHA
jgi:FAD synthase